jgi:hypothetical protein
MPHGPLSYGSRDYDRRKERCRRELYGSPRRAHRRQVNMRFATRVFLSSFVPFALLLAVSFWAIRASVITTVRNGLRASAWDNAVALNREQARNQARDRKWLLGVAENSTLKASVQFECLQSSMGSAAWVLHGGS